MQQNHLRVQGYLPESAEPISEKVADSIPYKESTADPL
jgi:hypothetical protein